MYETLSVSNSIYHQHPPITFTQTFQTTVDIAQRKQSHIPFLQPNPRKLQPKKRARAILNHSVICSHTSLNTSIESSCHPKRRGRYSRNSCTLFDSSANSKAWTARTPANVPKHEYSHNYRHVSNLSTRIYSTTQDLPQHHVRPLGRTVRIASVQEQESMLGIESHRFLLAAASRLALSTSRRGLASSGSMAVHNRRCYCLAVSASRPS